MKKYLLIIPVIALLVIGLAVNAQKAEVVAEPIKIDDAVLTKAEYITLKTNLAKKITDNSLSETTFAELRQIEDILSIQSKMCKNGFTVNGEFDWNAIRKIMELNC
mgnify:CR=1 FL=1